jgi:hypothetical protein
VKVLPAVDLESYAAEAVAETCRREQLSDEFGALSEAHSSLQVEMRNL